MENKIKVIIVPPDPNDDPYTRVINNTLKEIERIIKGQVKVVRTEVNNVVIIYNKEDKIHNSQKNIYGINGTILVTSISNNTLSSLSEFESRILLKEIQHEKKKCK